MNNVDNEVGKICKYEESVKWLPVTSVIPVVVWRNKWHTNSFKSISLYKAETQRYALPNTKRRCDQQMSASFRRAILQGCKTPGLHIVQETKFYMVEPLRIFTVNLTLRHSVGA